METIQINYNPEFKEKLFAVLKAFNPNEIQIVEKNKNFLENETFVNHKNRLQIALSRIDSGESKMYTLEEVDTMLEETISKYEN